MPMPLSVCTFNLKDFFAPEGEDTRALYERKAENLARLVAMTGADVVALQEVGAQGAERAVRDLFGRAVANAARLSVTAGTPDERGTCNVVVSRLPVLESEVHAPGAVGFPAFQVGDPTPFPGRLTLRRGIVRVRVAAESIGPVDVIACHLKSKVPTGLLDAAGKPAPGWKGAALGQPPRERSEAEVRSLVCRLAEALFVREIADSVFAGNPSAHVAVVGDLNDTLDSAPVNVIRAAGFRPPEPLAGALFPCTDVVAPERRFSILHDSPGEGAGDLFDHILVSWGLRTRLTHARILNDELRDHGPFDPDAEPAFDSDHAPVVAYFA